jgi:hypothetical protein
MAVKSKIKYISTAIFVMFFAGCAPIEPSSSVQSIASTSFRPDYNRRNIYVLSYVAKTQADFDKYLSESMVNYFSVKNYNVKYVSSNGLDLDASIHARTARENRSRYAMVIEPNGGTVAQYSLNFYLNTKYEVRCIDVDNRKVIFKAQIIFFPYRDPGIKWGKESAEKLSEDIFNELKKRGLV